MAVNSITGINQTLNSAIDTVKLQKDKSAIPFAEYLNSAMNNTNDLLIEADRMTEDFAAGKTDNIHQVLIAIEKADIALQFTMQVRNKIMDAYNEIMRMQI